MPKYIVKRIGTYYTVRDKETDKKHSEHSTMEKANNVVAYLEDIETGALTKPVVSRVSKYMGKHSIGSMIK